MVEPLMFFPIELYLKLQMLNHKLNYNKFKYKAINHILHISPRPFTKNNKDAGKLL